MKGPISTLVLCLALVLAAAGYGLYERHVGAQQAEARAHADSLLQVSQRQQDSLLVMDSVATWQSNHTRDSLSARLRALQRDYVASVKHADSAAVLALRDSLVPRDTVAALVTAFHEERHKADSTIQVLVADTLLLVGRIAQKDSTIAKLNTLLDGNRAQLAKALAPKSQGLLSRGAELVVKGLAVYGAVRLLGK